MEVQERLKRIALGRNGGWIGRQGRCCEDHDDIFPGCDRAQFAGRLTIKPWRGWPWAPALGGHSRR